MKTWFITGVSRGLGRALAKAALAEGDTVIGTVRDAKPDSRPGLANCMSSRLTSPTAPRWTRR